MATLHPLPSPVGALPSASRRCSAAHAHATQSGRCRHASGAPSPHPLGVLRLSCGSPHPRAAQLAAPARAAALCDAPAAAPQEGLTPAHSRDALMALKVVQLQALLTSHGLAKSGKKEVLVERLLAASTPAATDVLDSAPPPTPPPASRKGRRKASAATEPGTSLASAATSPAADSAGAAPAARTRRRAATSTAAHAAEAPPSPQQAPEPPGSQQGGSAAPAEQPEGGGPLPSFPELPAMRRRRSWAVQDRPHLSGNELRDLLMSNPTDLQLTLLGTAADRPSPGRALASAALCRGRDVWLFDVGDDTQRQLGCVPHVKPSKVYRAFVTSLAPECVLGLPGLLCSVSAARVRGHEKADIPVHVYGPEGLAEHLSTILKVSHTYMEINILVVELVHTAVPPSPSSSSGSGGKGDDEGEEEEEEQEEEGTDALLPAPHGETFHRPKLINRRARLFRVRVPPDQLNPRGFYDGGLAAFKPTQRAEGRAGRRGDARGGHRGGRDSRGGGPGGGGALAQDERAGFLPLPPCPPGDPAREGQVQPHEMSWTIHADVGARVVALALPGADDRPTFGYAFQEADRAGSLLVDRCEALGVPRGRSYALLKDGIAVTTKEGREVTPDMVLTPSKPGRRLLILGNSAALPPSAASAAPSAFARHAAGADAWVSGCVRHGGSGAEADGGRPEVPCVAAGEVGALAAKLGAQVLLLARFGTGGYPRAAERWADSEARLEREQAEGSPLPSSTAAAAGAQELEGGVQAALDEAQRAAAAVAAVGGRAPRVRACTDFWVQVFEKHDGPAPPADDDDHRDGDENLTA